jgi:actin-related protein 9
VPPTQPTQPEPIEVDPKPLQPEPVDAASKPVEPVTNGQAQKTGSGDESENGAPPKTEQKEEQDIKASQPNEGTSAVEPPTEETVKTADLDSVGQVQDPSQSAPAATEDVEMKEAPPAEATETAQPQDAQADTKEPTQEQTQQATAQDDTSAMVVEEEETELFEDDTLSDEGAVYPIVGGRIENWPCFFSLLSHIYNMMSPPFHMPVLFLTQPCWSARDHEMITQYVFENWKIPAFCLMDSALAACYAYGVPSAIVVDVGHEKCDVSAVTEFQVSEHGRGAAIAGCGGRDMTRRLQQVLEKEDFNEEMAEQLKKSAICEILPAGVEYPKAGPNGTSSSSVANPAAAASTGALDSGATAKDVEGLRPGQAPRGPGAGTTVGEEGANGEHEDNEGVLDVAAIVARDNAADFLAKRERERAEKAAAKKGAAAEGPRAMRLRNSEREKASFTYVDYVPYEDQAAFDQPMSRKRKREIEVGVERFMAATPSPSRCDGIIDIITESIHHAVLSVPDITSRSTLWENLIVVGNGSRIRGRHF